MKITQTTNYNPGHYRSLIDAQRAQNTGRMFRDTDFHEEVIGTNGIPYVVDRAESAQAIADREVLVGKLITAKSEHAWDSIEPASQALGEQMRFVGTPAVGSTIEVDFVPQSQNIPVIVNQVA